MKQSSFSPPGGPAFFPGAVPGGRLGLSLFPAPCAVNPLAGRQEFMLLSDEEEIRLEVKTNARIIVQRGLCSGNRG